MPGNGKLGQIEYGSIDWYLEHFIANPLSLSATFDDDDVNSRTDSEYSHLEDMENEADLVENTRARHLCVAQTIPNLIKLLYFDEINSRLHGRNYYQLGSKFRRSAMRWSLPITNRQLNDINPLPIAYQGRWISNVFTSSKAAVNSSEQATGPVSHRPQSCKPYETRGIRRIKSGLNLESVKQWRKLKDTLRHIKR
jgi:hypothetical protein